MTCLHPHPRSLKIPDWERLQDIVVVVCWDCGKVLEIRFGSRSGQGPKGTQGAEQEVRLETVY